jgi:hypothetical protein
LDRSSVSGPWSWQVWFADVPSDDLHQSTGRGGVRQIVVLGSTAPGTSGRPGTGVLRHGGATVCWGMLITTIPWHIAGVSASLQARADLGVLFPTYTFATPVFGGQLTVGAMGIYGRTDTRLAGSVTGALATPLGTLPFSRFDTISDSVTGFGDVLPMATLRWNNGVHNYMTYITGDIDVGAYDSTRLSNIGIGHSAIDAGGGYTYLNPQTGHEFSGVLGFTYNFTNQSTQYQNGVDMHFGWGASQFLTKQFLVGAVGYVYQEVGCDTGAGNRVGCFKSAVVGAGPQLGFIIPLTTETQGYLNLKSYWEFAHDNRPDGWNAWVTFVLSPAEQTPSTAPRRMITK